MSKAITKDKLNRVHKIISNCIDSAEEDGMVLVYGGVSYRDMLTNDRMSVRSPICGCLAGCILGDVPDKDDYDGSESVENFRGKAAVRLGITVRDLIKIEDGFEGKYKSFSDAWADEHLHDLGKGFRTRAYSWKGFRAIYERV